MSGSKPLSLEFVQKAIRNPIFNETCQQLHGGQCLLRAMRYFRIGVQNFAKMNFLYLIGLFIFLRRKKLLKNPKAELNKFLKGFIRTILFGGTFLGIGLYTECLVLKILGNNGYIMNFLGALFGSLSVLIQTPQRHAQITLYILPQTLRILCNMAQRRNITLNIPEGFSLLYGISMAIICYHYFNDKEILKKKYRSMFQKILGDC